MDSFKDDDNIKGELFTLRLKENNKDPLCKSLSSTCHPLIYSMKNNTMIKSHNNFETKFDICYDETSIDPPNKYLSDYTRALAICEDFFIKTPLANYSPDKYKDLLLEKIQNEVIPSFDCVLLHEIEKYIDYYLTKKKVHLERVCFKKQKNNDEIIRDKITNLREEIAIMDLDYGYDHFAIRKRSKRKPKHRSIRDIYTHTNVSANDSSNNNIRKSSQSIENNLLIKKIREKDTGKGISRNYSQPLIDIPKKCPSKALSSTLLPEFNQQQTKMGTNRNCNDTNRNNIISNIFSSIYQPAPKLYLNKRKVVEIEKKTSSNNNDNYYNNHHYHISLQNQNTLNNKSPNSLRNLDQKTSDSSQRLIVKKIMKLNNTSSSMKKTNNERYKLTPNLSMQNLNSKDTHLASSLRSATTNNTLTFIKGNKSLINSSKRTHVVRNYSKETNAHLIKTSMMIMKQYQNSLRKDTSVPHYKPRKKSTKMKPIPIPMFKHKKIIPYVYHINKKPVMHLKDYAIKQQKPFTNNRDNRHHYDDNEDEDEDKDGNDNDNDSCDLKWKLKKVLNTFYIKMCHNALLLSLLKTSTIYNKSQKEVKTKNNKVLYRNRSKGNIKRNVCYPETSAHEKAALISVKEKDNQSQMVLKHKQSFKCVKHL